MNQKFRPLLSKTYFADQSHRYTRDCIHSNIRGVGFKILLIKYQASTLLTFKSKFAYTKKRALLQVDNLLFPQALAPEVKN